MSPMSRLVRTVREDFANFHPVIALASLPARLLPDYAFRRLRTGWLRTAGWKIGYGTVFFGVPTIYGRGQIVKRLTVGQHSNISVECMFELQQPITIGDRAALGQRVTILTTTHRVGRHAERAGSTLEGPVTIGDGAWIGAGVTILPGVTIGAGAVVSAGSVVNKSVAPDTVVAGVPAVVVVKRLPG